MDYVNYITNERLLEKRYLNEADQNDMSMLEKFPQIKLANKFYLNKGAAKFDDAALLIKNNPKTYSNGAAYADFDNDGDIDIVVNNIDEQALIYKNLSNDGVVKRSFIEVNLKGAAANANAIGAKAIVFAQSEIRTYEKFPVRGFQGSMEVPLHIGLDKTKVDSIILVWPDNSYEKLPAVKDSILTVVYKQGLPQFNYKLITQHIANAVKRADDITDETGLFVFFTKKILLMNLIVNRLFLL